MNSAEKQTVLHCLKSMIDEEVCEECPLYGMTGTDHCEKDCIRLAINALEQEPCEDAISRQAVLDLAKFDGRDGLGSIIHAFDVEQLPPVKPAEKVGQWIDAEVLDKIRDEIVHLHDWAFDREEILRIIDKYKAESEG